MPNEFREAIFPAMIIVDNASTFDFTAATADISTASTGMLATLEAVTNSVSIGTETGDYSLLGDGFTIESIDGEMNNKENPHQTHVAKFLVPQPTGYDDAAVTLNDAFLALRSGGTYNAYALDPFSGTYGAVAEMLNCKVKINSTTTPEGKAWAVEVTTKRDGDFTEQNLIQVYVA